MRFLAGIFLCVVTMSSTAEEIRVLSGGAAKSFIEVAARERLARAGYTSPE